MKVLLATCVLVALAASALSEEVIGYHGYKTYRVVPTSEDQLNVLRTLSKGNEFDFWSEPRKVGRNVDVMVSPAKQSDFTASMEKYGLEYSVLIEDVEVTVQRENDEMEKSRKFNPGEKIVFTQYYEYDDIVAYVEDLASSYPNLVSVATIGTTYEGREIKGVTISSGGNGKRNAVLIEAGIHAREWIAPSTVLYLINQLVENSANSALTANIDWLIVPVTNPDGYAYTQSQRMWRKNRNKVSSLCKGADANRNFGFHWGGEGASTSPCDETYRGASAFSEKESSAVRDFAEANAGRIKVYLAMHSYGPYFLYPWGYQWDLPDDVDHLDEVARKTVAAITAVDGTEYEIGSSTQVLYAAAGGSDDYMKGGQGIALSYTVELPGGGSAGFNPPPSYILPIAKETFEGYKVIAKVAEQE